jgi:drug/metabolite transporter (DMT)-like permease
MTARITNMSKASPEMQLVYQLAVSAIVLLPIAFLFGPVIREVTHEILGIFAFQVIFVVSFGFLSWFWILRIYPASDMAAFSFLAPVFGVIAAWLILDEVISPAIWIALVLVGCGIAFVSWKPKRG